MLYLLGFLLPGLTLWQIHQGGAGTFMGVGLVFLFHPALDLVFSKVKVRNDSRFQNQFAEMIFFLVTPFLVIFLFLSLRQISLSESPFEIIGIILSAGLVMGYMGITSAHELIHRPSQFQKAIGVFHLMLVNFAQFRISHLEIHHKYVGTSLDPATAKKNQNIFSYWLKSFFGNFSKAWELEVSQGRRFFRNRMFCYALVTTFAATILYLNFGSKIMLAWFGISIVAIALLQSADYIEHYALTRNELKPGVFEAIKPHHSWDTDSALTNYLLFNLGLHSHHHTRSQLPFTDLRMGSESKVLPYGYSVMIIRAMIPPLWKRSMASILATRQN